MAPSTWTRDTVDRYYTALVDDALRRDAGARPSTVAEAARDDLERAWLLAHPGKTVPRYIARLGLPPDEDLEPDAGDEETDAGLAN